MRCRYAVKNLLVPCFRFKMKEKSKWKCKVCTQELSSKQKVENHIKSLHPDDCIFGVKGLYSRVTASVNNNKLESKSSKPAAYSSFSGLYSIFSDKDICRRFELYPSSKSSGNGQVSSDTTITPASIECSVDQIPTEVIQNRGISEANIDSVHTEAVDGPM